MQVIRAQAKRKPTIGWSSAGFTCYPATETTENIEAARKATLDVFAGHVWNNRWWGDAAILGVLRASELPQFRISAIGCLSS